MKTVTTLLTIVLLGIAGAGTYLYLGVYDIAADTPHSAPVYELLEILRERSIAVRAVDIKAPPLDDPALIAEGAEHYSAMCSGCHLAPGMDDTEIRAGLYPPPPSLVEHEHGEHHADLDMLTAAARQFWIIKHGIKLTAMPAWGATHSDDAIWGLVAFLRKLPELSAEKYKAMTSSEGGHEHGESAHHEEDAEQHHTSHSHTAATGVVGTEDAGDGDAVALPSEEHGGHAH